MIYNVWGYDDMTHILRELHWFPLREWVVHFNTLILVYKYMHDTAPMYLRGLLEIYDVHNIWGFKTCDGANDKPANSE